MDTPIPFAGCFSVESDPTLPLAFAGLPCDSQSTFRRGPAEGPSRIRLAYDGRCYNATTELGADLAGLVSDAGDWLAGGSWEESREDYRFRAEELLAGEAVPFFAGGDHAITMPLVEALEVIEEPVHVVQLDAHPDLYPEFDGDRWSHACVGARILEMEHVASLTQIGIRTLNQPQLEVARRHAGRLTILEARDLSFRPSDLSHIPEGAPGVSHPVPGGITPRQALALIQEAPWRLVGMDAVEVNPSLDQGDRTAVLAARLLHEAMGRVEEPEG